MSTLTSARSALTTASQITTSSPDISPVVASSSNVATSIRLSPISPVVSAPYTPSIVGRSSTTIPSISLLPFYSISPLSFSIPTFTIPSLTPLPPNPKTAQTTILPSDFITTTDDQVTQSLSAPPITPTPTSTSTSAPSSHSRYGRTLHECHSSRLTLCRLHLVLIATLLRLLKNMAPSSLSPSSFPFSMDAFAANSRDSGVVESRVRLPKVSTRLPNSTAVSPVVFRGARGVTPARGGRPRTRKPGRGGRG